MNNQCFFLQETTTYYPVIHNINALVVQELVQNKCSFGKFWQTGQGNYCEFVFKFDCHRNSWSLKCIKKKEKTKKSIGERFFCFIIKLITNALKTCTCEIFSLCPR